MTPTLRCPGPACGHAMHPETREGVTADRCGECGGLWFDARELDAWLASVYPAGAVPPEGRIPRRGIGGRRCPRCGEALETAGWTGMVLDRCPGCRGLFVEVREIADLERAEPPYKAESFEQQLQRVMVTTGWQLFIAKGYVLLLLRFLR